jgi:hypothetical protein
LQTYKSETIFVEAHQLSLSGTDDPTRGPAVVARVDPMNNLPTSQAYRRYADNTVTAPVNVLSATLSVVSLENNNLSEPEKQLLHRHFRLGHLGFRKI